MKNYFFIFLVLGLFNFGHCQSIEIDKKSSTITEDLRVFPNPVENGKLYITSKDNLPESIEIYNVLGKRVVKATLKNRVIDISKLSPGIYILKLKVKELIATRKLVVR